MAAIPTTTPEKLSLAEAHVANLLESEPDLAIGLWYKLANDLYEKLPALTVDGDDLVCPHCEHRHLNGRYLVGRTWDTSFSAVTLYDMQLKIEDSDMGPEFQALYYECAECERGVKLPPVGPNIQTIDHI